MRLLDGVSSSLQLFMSVQSVEVILNHIAAVYNGFGHYEARGKSALLCEGLAWKDDRDATITEVGLDAGPVPEADEHTSIHRETYTLTYESACVAGLRDRK